MHHFCTAAQDVIHLSLRVWIFCIFRSVLQDIAFHDSRFAFYGVCWMQVVLACRFCACWICACRFCMPRLDVGVECQGACRIWMSECMSILHVSMHVGLHVGLHVLKEVSASRMLFRMGKSAYGVLSPSPNLPLRERWGVSPVATGDKGSALDPQAFEKA